MRRDEALQTLAANREQLARFGIASLELFRSVARDEATAESGVDLVEFEGRLTYDRYCDLRFHLEDLLGTGVDLVPGPELRPRVRPWVERDAIRIA
ncbi:MAG: nucleotidyltransferase family protein [Tepidiformaceae bacterium]